MTRALKNAVLQQQMISVDKALQILDQEIPPLVVDRDKLKVWDAVGVCTHYYSSVIVTRPIGFQHLDFS